MRIRQVKPSFWTDPTIAAISYPARLFYIGLWGVADDAGYIEWKPVEIGALLFPYESPSRRARHINEWTAALVEAGRLRVMDCGCAVIPTLPQHQRIAGKQAFTNRDRHLGRHRSLPVATDSPGNGTVGNVKVGNVNARESIETTTGESEFRRMVPIAAITGKAS
jgi:hypothetical protein